MKSTLVAMAIGLVALSMSTFAVDSRDERVQFAPGTSGTTIKETITGYQTVNYKLVAKAGQTMVVELKTDNGANYFNIFAPGKGPGDEAMFIGSTSGGRYEGMLPEDGEYTVQVYLMRSAARRDERANYTLSVGISGGAVGAVPPGDAKVPGTPYHATGEIPCAMVSGQPTGSCPFGVTPEGNGTGIVTVTKPDGRTRAIFFKNGNPTGYDQSQADPGEFSAEKQGDLSVISIGQERYEIPDAVIFGG
jgi:hypothetical protein